MAEYDVDGLKGVSARDEMQILSAHLDHHFAATHVV